MSTKKEPAKERQTRDTAKQPETGNFSDPRIRWPEDEWQRTEQPGGDRPPSRARGGPSAGRPRAGGTPGLSKVGHGSAAGSNMNTHIRTDEAISAEVRAELEADEQCDATAIAIEVRDGVVVLEGRVATRPMKRRAAEIANAARDVRSVDNRLRVG